jgi:hypothetical protein
MGVSLNGVDHWELINHSKLIFAAFQCITKVCSIFTKICTSLETISPKACMKFQEPVMEDNGVLQ